MFALEIHTKCIITQLPQRAQQPQRAPQPQRARARTWAAGGATARTGTGTCTNGPLSAAA